MATKITLFIIALMMFLSSSFAQGGSIAGKVLEEPNKARQNINVTLKLEGNVEEEVSTDENGEYIIENVEPGTYLIEFTREYCKYEKIDSVLVSPGASLIMEDVVVTEENFFETISRKTSGTWNWVVSMATLKTPWNQNYLYGLILVSLLVLLLEIAFPWRKDQKIIRKDFWLDAFYMFFNFFIFSIVIAGVYAVIEKSLGGVDVMSSIALFDKSALLNWAFLIVFFIVNDFVQWFTHVMLHKFPVLWRFHKVHHSVQEMGFAAHLRYHWMENIFYKPLKTFAVMILIGAEPEHAFFMHFFSILIGHLNHANVRITWGPLKYVFNNSVMHLYHHAKELPADRTNGVNFGISLSIWDYIFKKNYIPQDQDGSYVLGFEGIENYPKGFFRQLVSGFKKN